MFGVAKIEVTVKGTQKCGKFNFSVSSEGLYGGRKYKPLMTSAYGVFFVKNEMGNILVY